MPIPFVHIRITKFGLKQFWLHVDKRGEDECWPWTGRLDACGYGQSGMGGSTKQASRVAWVLEHGEQPKGYICHKCDNRTCVNPAHLYDGDQTDNMRDMVARRRNWQSAVTHCPQGHEYAGENLWVDKNRRRHCRACSREKTTRWWKANRSAAARAQTQPGPSQ